jgi:hypothetical protein
VADEVFNHRTSEAERIRLTSALINLFEVFAGCIMLNSDKNPEGSDTTDAQ